MRGQISLPRPTCPRARPPGVSARRVPRACPPGASPRRVPRRVPRACPPGVSRGRVPRARPACPAARPPGVSPGRVPRACPPGHVQGTRRVLAAAPIRINVHLRVPRPPLSIVAGHPRAGLPEPGEQGQALRPAGVTDDRHVQHECAALPASLRTVLHRSNCAGSRRQPIIPGRCRCRLAWW